MNAQLLIDHLDAILTLAAAVLAYRAARPPRPLKRRRKR
jgi:hypothetical protein